jgi:hypothetical protein
MREAEAETNLGEELRETKQQVTKLQILHKKQDVETEMKLKSTERE